MARIRTIKPDYYCDSDILKLSIACRYFYPFLWGQADDNGVIEYNVPSLKARIFPFDEVNLDLLISELLNLNKLILFEKGGRRYIWLKKMKNHQIIDRPRKTNLPLPEGVERSSNSRFSPPSPQEVTEYAKSIHYELNGEKFIAFYESKGWMIGKNKIKSWKAAVKTWKIKDQEDKNNGGTRGIAHRTGQEKIVGAAKPTPGQFAEFSK